MGFNDQARALAATTAKEKSERYEKGLRALKPAGYGNGTHQALLGVASCGVRAGIPGEQIFAEIRKHLPPGARAVRDTEIWGAINKALADGGKPPLSALITGQPRVRPELRDAIVAQGIGTTAEDIVAASPITIPNEPALQQRLLLTSIYKENDFLFIGDRYGSDVRTVHSWLDRVAAGKPLGPHVIPNPLSGAEAPTKDGKLSRRADSCVAAFRFAVVEFDALPVDQQLAFWAAVKLPVAALIDSGGKSIHGWVRVDAPNRSAWERDVEVGLFAERLVPLGVDSACRNEARLSRMPGFTRKESGRLQRLLYLAPEGKAVGA